MISKLNGRSGLHLKIYDDINSMKQEHDVIILTFLLEKNKIYVVKCGANFFSAIPNQTVTEICTYQGGV
jgi:hypothetical protein